MIRRAASSVLRAYGILLIVAAALKAQAPKGILNVLRFDGVPVELLHFTFWSVLTTEIIVGSWLLFGENHSRPRLWTGCLLSSGLALQQLLLLAGGVQGCGCLGSFGQYFRPGATSAVLSAVNLLVLAACIACLRSLQVGHKPAHKAEVPLLKA